MHPDASRIEIQFAIMLGCQTSYSCFELWNLHVPCTTANWGTEASQLPVPACGTTFHQDYDGRDSPLTLLNSLFKTYLFGDLSA